MNVLDTNVNGGYPIELDDFRFLDDIYRTGIHQIIKSFSSFAILTGCEFGLDVNSNEKVNAGWVVINGEIGFLPETIGLSDSIDYGVVADNYLDNSVVKVTQAGASVKPHQIRQFKVEPYHPSMGDDVKLWQLKQLKEVLKSEFGLNSQSLNRSWKTDQPSTFTWNTTFNRWESIMSHELPVGVLSIQSVSVCLYRFTPEAIVSLPDGFFYEVDDTNIIIVDPSSQASNDDLRGLVATSGLKVVFEYL